MEQIDFQKVVNELKATGHILNPDLVYIKVPNAKEHLRRGLEYFCGPTIEWHDGYDAIAEWLTDNKGKGLVLIGGCGVGKTVICTKVIPVLLNYYCGKFVNVFHYSEFNSNVSAIMGSKIVCLDDVGVEREHNNYGIHNMIVKDVVDKAERNGNMLLMTSNLTTDELERKYDARTFDRLRGMTKLVRVKGNSNR